jgi:hypothetical protein
MGLFNLVNFCRHLFLLGGFIVDTDWSVVLFILELVVFDVDKVFEVVLDGLDRVRLTHHVCGLLGYHHLGRVGVTAQRARHY